MPPFVGQAHDGPARPVGVVELVEEGPGQGQLDRERVLGQKAPHGMVVSVVAKLALHDAHQFPVMNRRVKLFGNRR